MKMNTTLHIKTSLDYFKLLQNQFNQNFEKTLGEHTMFLTEGSKSLKGSVRGMQIKKNKFFTEIEITSENDFNLTLPGKNYDAIHFLYCQKGEVVQKFSDNSSQVNILEEYQTAIVSNRQTETILEFKAGQYAKVIVISVCQSKGEGESSIAKNIHSLFLPKMVDNAFVYFGSFNLKIAEQIKRLDEIDQVGIVRKLYIEGIVQLILAMEIQHHQDDVKSINEYSGSLTKRELVVLKELGEEIKANLEKPYTIKYLTEQTGISAAKMQEGFKLLFGRTVTDYIKNIRVEAAEELIKTTDMNISEIVYSIGLTSRSYFSKIFKEKYNCSPRYYQESLKTLAATA